MFDAFYPYKFVTKKKQLPGDFFLHKSIFSFKTEKFRFIAEAEHYEHEMYVLKFYPKHLSEASNKFNVLLNAEYAPQIIRTCINIMLEIVASNPFANFGFWGSNTILENYKEGKYMTQRYRIYRQLMLNFFSENSYQHIENQTNSAYLLLNKSNQNLKQTLIDIETMFIKYYSDLDSE